MLPPDPHILTYVAWQCKEIIARECMRVPHPFQGWGTALTCATALEQCRVLSRTSTDTAREQWHTPVAQRVAYTSHFAYLALLAPWRFAVRDIARALLPCLQQAGVGFDAAGE